MKNLRLMPNGGTVVVGMSGGVDSAVTAYLLQKAGLDVIGVTLRSWEGENNRCCEIDKARLTARKLGIRYYPWNIVAPFKEYVTDPFTDEYTRGLTPNPCVECNRYVKWAGLLHVADVFRAEYVATGHYAAVAVAQNGRLTVAQATDRKKDQSYMLYKLTQEQLARTVLPLGGLTKDQTREIAAAANIAVPHQAESQEICFIPEGKYEQYLQNAIGRQSAAFTAGNFVDETGKVLGRHRGIACYTVGQRKGLGIALGYPAYVKKIRAATNEIVLCAEKSLYVTEIFCNRLTFMGIESLEQGEEIRALVRIRYHHSGEFAQITRTDIDTARLVFERPVRAPAPGQSAVFYDEDFCVLGGGKII